LAPIGFITALPSMPGNMSLTPQSWCFGSTDRRAVQTTQPTSGTFMSLFLLGRRGGTACLSSVGSSAGVWTESSEPSCRPLFAYHARNATNSRQWRNGKSNPSRITSPPSLWNGQSGNSGHGSTSGKGNLPAFCVYALWRPLAPSAGRIVGKIPGRARNVLRGRQRARQRAETETPSSRSAGGRFC
jgi:hypothetical protein